MYVSDCRDTDSFNTTNNRAYKTIKLIQSEEGEGAYQLLETTEFSKEKYYIICMHNNFFCDTEMFVS